MNWKVACKDHAANNVGGDMRFLFLRALSPLCWVMLLAPPSLKADLLSVGSASVFVGNTVIVPVMITAASDLYAFQFELSYDHNILQLLKITEGPFLSTAG